MSAFVLGLVIFIIRNAIAEPTVQAKTRLRVSLYLIFSWVGTLMAVLLCALLPLVVAIPLGLSLLILVMPSVLARILAHGAWVKCCYYLGTVSGIYFRHDHFAGGILRGLQACQKIHDADERKQALLWLKSRFQRNDHPLRSGSMVLYVALNHELECIDKVHTRDHEHALQLAQKLLLNNLHQKSLPGAVLAYVLKLVLPGVVMQVRWDLVEDLATTFSVRNYCAVARYLLAFSRYYLYVDGSADQVPTKVLWMYRWRRLLLVDQSLALLLEQQYVQYRSFRGRLKQYPVGALWLSELWQPQELEALAHKCLNDAEAQRWRLRAEALGVWDFDSLWQGFAETLDQLTRAHGGNWGEMQYQQALEDSQRIGYLLYGLSSRLEEHEKMNGIAHYDVWLQCLELFHHHKAWPELQDQLFFDNFESIWNWLVHLWNHSDEHYLAVAIINTCLPMAQRVGLHDFVNNFDRISLPLRK